jgi:membrane protein implicated in regulation of membrane protease activity
MGLGDRISASVVDVRAHAQRLVQLNIELLKAEMQKKGQQYGIGVGLLIAAVVLALYAFGLLLALIVVALALVLPLWLSLLIVTVVLFVIVAILAAVGRSRLRQAKTPTPQGAIAEAQNTVGQLRGGVKKTLGGVSVRAKQGGAAPGATPGVPGAGSAAPPGASQSVRPGPVVPPEEGS